MGKIIQFPQPSAGHDEDETIFKLKEVSDILDNVILDAIVERGIEPKEIAGLLAHRLGALMRRLESKDALWDVCEKVAKKQAAIDCD